MGKDETCRHAVVIVQPGRHDGESREIEVWFVVGLQKAAQSSLGRKVVSLGLSALGGHLMSAAERKMPSALATSPRTLWPAPFRIHVQFLLISQVKLPLAEL